MPKTKTKSGAKKRFSITGSGKVKREKPYHGHMLTSKSQKRKRSLRQSTLVADTESKTVKRMLGAITFPECNGLLMKKNIFLSVIIFFTLLSSGKSSAQDTLQSRFGIFFGLANNVHSADFSALPGLSAASGNYSVGYGNGFAISLLYDYPINDLLFIDGRFGYIDHSVILFAANGQADVFVKGAKTTSSVTRSIELVAGSYGLEARLGVHVIKGLIISAGLRMGFLSLPKFIQQDSASQGTFADTNGIDTKRGMRNQHAGDLPNAASILFHGILSLGYEFPINRKHTTFIVPEITYTPALNNIVKGITWKTDAVVYGITLKFSF